jgi:hypothetical protein
MQWKKNTSLKNTSMKDAMKKKILALYRSLQGKVGIIC